MKAVINGIDSYFVDLGNTAEQTVVVVLIHGFPFSHEMWDQQIERLRESVRVIAYDVRGHGRSGVSDGQYTIEFFVDDLIGLMDHLKVKKAVLCGLSMGGYIALRAVERNPERIEGLILCETQSAADSNEAKVRRSASIKAVKAEGVDAYAEGFVKAVFAPTTLVASADRVAMIKKLIQSNSSLAICGTLLALAARTDTTGSLPGIKVPTLILVGENDVLTPPLASQEMHGRIPSPEFHLIANAAHMSNVENPEAVQRPPSEVLG